MQFLFFIVGLIISTNFDSSSDKKKESFRFEYNLNLYANVCVYINKSLINSNLTRDSIITKADSDLPSGDFQILQLLCLRSCF